MHCHLYTGMADIPVVTRTTLNGLLYIGHNSG